MKCRHKYGRVQKDGYQYCEKCGRAEIAPCKHKWFEREVMGLKYWGSPSGKIIVFECLTCKAIRQERIDVWE